MWALPKQLLTPLTSDDPGTLAPMGNARVAEVLFTKVLPPYLDPSLRKKVTRCRAMTNN